MSSHDMHAIILADTCHEQYRVDCRRRQETFIEAVRNFVCLEDCTDPGYKDQGQLREIM